MLPKKRTAVPPIIVITETLLSHALKTFWRLYNPKPKLAGQPWTYLETKRSKFKVTRPNNAHTVNAQYLPNGKAYELRSWYTDGAYEDPYHRQAPWLPRSNIKVARSRDSSESCWPISWERKVPETPNFLGRLPTPRIIKRTNFKVKRSNAKVTKPTNAAIKSVSYFPNW